MMLRKRTSEKGALELLEEAVHLLRLASLPTLICYCVGSFPFVLGFLFFWADMSRSAFAAEHCGRAAFGMVLLFIWMKTWQTIFLSGLTAQITGKPSASWTLSRIARVALAQTILQPSGFFILPVAFVIMLPFSWAFAFYQNVTLFAGSNDAGSLFKKAMQQANLFQRQNILALLILSAFTIFVWINLVTLIVIFPSLLKMFLGIETVFTRSGYHAFFNTTFFAASFALTYLCVDPLIKSFYALRCFYGQALATGEDLKVELRSSTSAAGTLAAILICLFSLTANASSETKSQALPVRTSSPTVPTANLDNSIREVLTRPEFTWRQPRVKMEKPETEKGWLVLFLESIRDTLLSWLRTLRDWGRNFVDWINKYFRKKNSVSESTSSGDNWMGTLQVMVFVLLALIATGLALLFFRMWKRREKKTVVVAQAILTTPDLNNEDVAANQLPEDGWLKLARELMEKGDLRLALRAFYLAGLAHLAEREFVSIAKFKSNREYELELRRRARTLPELQSAFGQNVTTFDRIWYGMHEVTQESLERFQSNLERIRTS